MSSIKFKNKIPTMMKCFLVLFLTLTVAQAFVVSRQTAGSSTSLSMAPKYDKKTQKWSPTKPEESPEAGYSASKTLLLHGPKPFFQRIFTPDDYEQAVLKFMDGDKCSRDVAQGNMDAYLRNPGDWAYNRMDEERKGYKVDYVTIDKNQVALSGVWAIAVAGLAARAVYAITHGEDFYAFGPFTGSY